MCLKNQCLKHVCFVTVRFTQLKTYGMNLTYVCCFEHIIDYIDSIAWQSAAHQTEISIDPMTRDFRRTCSGGLMVCRYFILIFIV